MFWTWGFINLLFGATIVALQNVWKADWKVVVTVCGWAALIKGTWIILFPGSAKAIYHNCNKPAALTFGGAFAAILGVILLWHGFAW